MVEELSKLESGFDSYDEEVLINFIEENTKAVKELEFENLMLDRYIKRFDIKPEEQMDQISNEYVRASRKRSRSRNATNERTLRLTAEQKCTIAQMEIEDYKQESKSFHQQAEKILDGYKALLEEAHIQILDIEKFKYDYEKNIQKRAFQPRYNAIMAEKLIRFLEEHLRSQDTLVDKLRLNNTTLRVQKKKMLSQRRQKEEMGEVLHEVDFDQLKIENSQFLELIDGKNKELLRLKLTTGKVLQALNSLRRRLGQLQQESDLLRVEIKSRDDMVARTIAETTKVLREKKKVGAQVSHLKQLMADYSVPPALNYVESVREMRRLKRKEKIQNRKVAISKINLDRYRRMWHQINQTTALLPF